MNPKRCKTCGEELTSHTCYPADLRSGRLKCKECHKAENRERYSKNPENTKKLARERHYKNGAKPNSENKTCSQHLGIHIAESMVESIFDVERAPTHQPGYDFINRVGETIDVKASTKRASGNWFFNIRQNTIADYFLCIAFDNGKPVHMWMIPGIEINTKIALSVSPSTTDKLKEYEKVIPSILR